MDEMKISSKWTVNIISKIINSVVHKKLGNKGINLDLNEIKIISTSDAEGKFCIHMDVNAEVTRGAIVDILKMSGVL